MPARPWSRRVAATVVVLTVVVVAATVLVAWAAGHVRGTSPARGLVVAPAPTAPALEGPPASTPARPVPPSAVPAAPPERVFADRAFLVAFYGTAGTGALGVLGEDPPGRMHRRLARAARPFGTGAGRVQEVYELIVTVADARPGRDGDYNHDISRRQVRHYLAAAERRDALVLLDVQPGRASFPAVARRWRWALERPGVGLALDPEWRMGPGEVPGRVIGGVHAREVNRTSRWLAGLVRDRGLPEKLFVLHQFKDSMIRGIGRIADRRGLATVQHVDGFGTPGQKLHTYGSVARPDRFTMGLKLFYDEDVPRMSAADVRRIRPRVRFVSFQ